jgi:hypothetical protein
VAKSEVARKEVTMTKNRLVGTWRLVSYEIRGPDGQILYPFGENPVGYLMYGEDGYMHAALMKANRPRMSVEMLVLGTTEEKAWAAVYFESYCGRYEIKGDKVFHHVEVSLNPNWPGEVLERGMQLKDDTLVLTTLPVPIFGIPYIGRLAWKRV